MSELEGAILLEVRRMNSCTAYEVQRSFLESPTPEWSAGAGSIYPAIKRLVKRQWISASPRSEDRRSTEMLSLTTAGHKALASWATDTNLLSSPGQDPFRLRAPYWLSLNNKKRLAICQDIEASIKERLLFLDKLAKQGGFESQTRTELERNVQRMRLKWIRRWIR